MTSVEIMAPLSQAYCVPPSCKAKFKVQIATRKRRVPGQSIKDSVFLLILRGTTFLGKAQKVTAMRTAPVGTLKEEQSLSAHAAKLDDKS